MKPIKASEDLMKQIEEMENKKAYQTMNANMKSKIIGHSSNSDKEPDYFIRADYFKDESLGRTPQEYWSIPNPNTVYFTDTRQHLQNMKDLMKTEENLGITSSTGLYYKEKKKRYDFLIESRKISQQEFDERMANERIQLIVRE
jgi:hypothetical protein